MANTKNTSNADIIKYLTAEIKETQVAIDFVTKNLTSMEHGATYARKLAEYTGAINALRGVLDLLEGKAVDVDQA